MIRKISSTIVALSAFALTASPMAVSHVRLGIPCIAFHVCKPCPPIC